LKTPNRLDMKNRLLQFALLSGASICSVQAVLAQDDMSIFLKSGLDNGNKLINAYASPMLNSFGTGLNAGWFNTAKPHGALGFDFTFSTNLVLAPTSAQTFDVNSLGLSSQMQVLNGKNTSQTVFGSNKDDENPELGLFARYPGATQDSLMSSFRLPAGSGVNFFPVPTAQLTVGVGYGTDVSVRFLPTISSGDFKVGMIGGAIKHDFKQWIPGMKELPFDLSAMVGFTTMNADFKMEAMGADPADNYTYNPNSNKTYDNQALSFKSTAWTTNVIISKKLLFFTPYAALGYQSSSTTLTMQGDYPLTDVNANFDITKAYGTPGYNAADPNSHPRVVKELKDPLEVKGTIGSFRATAGFRLKLAILTIHADYTYSEYSVASIGVGLNVQSLVPPKL
jgi:hypothetical protein